MKSLTRSLLLISVALLVAIQGVFAALPAMVAAVLTRPSGYFAAWIMKADASVQSGAVVFTTAGLEVQVTALCSGAGFFSILSATLLYLILLTKPSARMIALLLIALWPIAIATNAARIILSAQLRALAGAYLTPRYYDVVHQATGAAVFLSALFLLVLIILQTIRHDKRLPAI